MSANRGKLFRLAWRLSPALGVFAAGAAMTALAWAVAESRVQADALAKVDAALAQAGNEIAERVQSSFDVLYGAQGLFRASERVTRAEFQDYVSGLGLARRHPGIRTVVYAELVPGSTKEAFEAALRANHRANGADYASFTIRPTSARDEYLPIVYVEPEAGRANALGLDLLVGTRREAAEQARDTGKPVVSARLALAVDPAGEPAFTVRLALYRRGMPTGTPEERRAAFRGVVSISFIARNLVSEILTDAALAPLTVALYDPVSVAGASHFGAEPVQYILYERRGATSIAPGQRNYFSKTRAIEIGGRNWQLHFTGSTRDFMTPTDYALPWILLLGGLAMSALLAALVQSLASARARAHRLAARITDDLRRSEANLAEAQRLTESMIEALPNPIFYKGTDGRYRGVNQAWEKFFGIPRSAFIGKTVHDLYPHDRPVADRLHALDQALWERPGTQTYEAVIPTAHGTRHDVVYYKATYTRSNGAVVGIIGTIIDMSERKQAERRQIMEHAITRVLAESDAIPAAMTKVIRIVCEAMGWDYGDRYEYDPGADVLRRREMWAVDTPYIQALTVDAESREVKPDASGAGLVRRTFATAKPVWIADISKQQDLRRKELVANAGLHGAFAFPLVASGHVLGVMEFFHRDVREPDAMLIQIAEAIGSQMGQFLVRMQAEEAVKFVAMHDALTQLPNRVMFNQRLEQAIAQAERHEKRLAVMFIDLDRFKVINDTLGHEAGDLLLREVARRITEHLRTGDIVARLGGDEFVVLLEDVGEPASIGAVAEKLIAALTQNFVIGGREMHVTASIGVATYPLDGKDLRSLMKYADIAMYRAKEQGRNTFQFYSEQINVHSLERLTLESQLKGALERDELVLHYQPVIDTRSGAIVSMEALVRWRHPEAGLLPPGKFIVLAEETGLIVPIGHWVLHAACEQQRKWRDLGLPRMRIAVNLSPRQFVQRNLVQDIVRVLAGAQCEGSLLELEITEGTVMHNAARTVELLAELKAMGVRIAIDDFGTGYSSLAYLKRFPIDSLKIDRSFVSDVPHDPGNTAITQAIIAMAHSLELKVIAEGVETREQLDFLREHGCDEAQGYYFGRPAPVEDATALLVAAQAPQVASNVRPLGPTRRRG